MFDIDKYNTIDDLLMDFSDKLPNNVFVTSWGGTIFEDNYGFEFITNDVNKMDQDEVELFVLDDNFIYKIEDRSDAEVIADSLVVRLFGGQIYNVNLEDYIKEIFYDVGFEFNFDFFNFDFVDDYDKIPISVIENVKSIIVDDILDSKNLNPLDSIWSLLPELALFVNDEFAVDAIWDEINEIGLVFEDNMRHGQVKGLID